ncbi:hypothetical protein PDJAM_G00137940 [Pangasius djambal]|uniref:Uncharacterized protein n=1 Tax=Pangasius djambal TaxID=1691987 RepID=A0ACC5ZG18_9TELE|nr:hypothetical protein [Pangasius djambal]
MVVIQFQLLFYRGQVHGEYGVYPKNTGHEVGIHPGWDAGPSQGTTRTHSMNPPTGMFLGGGRKLENPEETHTGMEAAHEECVAFHKLALFFSAPGISHGATQRDFLGH